MSTISDELAKSRMLFSIRKSGKYFFVTLLFGETKRIRRRNLSFARTHSSGRNNHCFPLVKFQQEKGGVKATVFYTRNIQIMITGGQID